MLEWVSVDIKTGSVVADLPDLSCSTIKRTLGRYESCTASLPIPTAPENWLDATVPGRVAMLLLSNSVPIWGGMVTQRKRGTSPKVEMSLATLESYLDRRYVGTIGFTQKPQNTIVNDLLYYYVYQGPRGGLPLRIEQLADAVNPLRDRAYFEKDDKTVYSILGDLSGVLDGPEWTIEWEYQEAANRYVPVFLVGGRIGKAPALGQGPAATFDHPGCVSEAEYVEDYSNGQGANNVMATSSGEGDTRPQSPLQLGPDDGRVTFDYRWSPSTSITSIDTLTAHAKRALQFLAPGSTALTLKASVEAAPSLGVDWMLGDDIGVELLGPAFPVPVRQTMRCIGWELELGSTPMVAPILFAPGIGES